MGRDRMLSLVGLVSRVLFLLVLNSVLENFSDRICLS